MVGPHQRLLQPLLLVGNHSTIVLLGTCAGGGHHGPHRHEVRRIAVLLVLRLPNVLVQPGLGRHHLAAVDDRSAAHGEDKVDATLTDETGTLLRLGVGRIGRDASKVRHLFAALAQPSRNLIIQSRALQRAAAVCQQHVLSRAFHLFLDGAFRASLAKMLANGILIREIFHSFSFFYIIFIKTILLINVSSPSSENGRNSLPSRPSRQNRGASPPARAPPPALPFDARPRRSG